MEKNLKRRGKKEELSLSTSTSKLLEYISILEAKIEDTSRKDKSLLEEEEEKKEIEELTEKLNLSFREEKKRDSRRGKRYSSREEFSLRKRKRYSRNR